MNISSGRAISLLLADPRLQPHLGRFRTPVGSDPGIFVIGFPFDGQPEGCIIGVAPIPTGWFSRHTNGTLRGGDGVCLVVHIYQYPADSYTAQLVVPLVADILATQSCRVSYYESESKEGFALPYWELECYGEWGLSEFPAEIGCLAST